MKPKPLAMRLPFITPFPAATTGTVSVAVVVLALSIFAAAQDRAVDSATNVEESVRQILSADVNG